MRLYCQDATFFRTQDLSIKKALRVLFECLETGQHTLTLAADSDQFLQEIESLELGPDRRDALEGVLVDAQRADWSADPVVPPVGIYAELCCFHSQACTNARWQIRQMDLSFFIRRPLYLLLENQQEASFLRWIIALYGRDRLEKAFDNQFRWVEVRGMGGCGEIKSTLELLNTKGSRGEVPGMVLEGHQGDGRALLRYFVWTDRDTLSKDAPMPKTIQEIENVCKELRVGFWIRKKRELENYLPEPLLKGVLTKRTHGRNPGFVENKLKNWSELSSEQKDFCDMKYWPRETKNKKPGDPDAVFGTDVLKDTMSLENTDSLCTIDALEARAGDELRHLLDALEAWL